MPMYSSHSKDINRNKSFHTLTYANLRKVEILKEKEEEKAKSREDRRKELQRDQEERRYRELIGEEGAFSGSTVIKNIFAAEYEAERVAASSSADASTPSSIPAKSKYLKRFVKDEEGEESMEKKRFRAEGECKTEEKAVGSSSSAAVQTGFISTSEAARMRLESESQKKDSVDPLKKFQEYEQRMSAAARRRIEKEGKESEVSRADGGRGASTVDGIRSKILDLLDVKKK